MSHPLLIFSQSNYLIQVVHTNSNTNWQTVQIQISWLLQKPTDLDLHCLPRQGISELSRTRVKSLVSLPCNINVDNYSVSFLLSVSMVVTTPSSCFKLYLYNCNLRHVMWKSVFRAWTYSKNIQTVWSEPFGGHIQNLLYDCRTEKNVWMHMIIWICAINIYCQTSMAQTSLGPWKIVGDMGSLSHWGLILVPGQETNGDNIGKSFRSYI